MLARAIEVQRFNFAAGVLIVSSSFMIEPGGLAASPGCLAIDPANTRHQTAVIPWTANMQVVGFDTGTKVAGRIESDCAPLQNALQSRGQTDYKVLARDVLLLTHARNEWNRQLSEVVYAAAWGRQTMAVRYSGIAAPPVLVLVL